MCRRKRSADDFAEEIKAQLAASSQVTLRIRGARLGVMTQQFQFFVEKGGGGVFFAGNASYVLDLVGVVGWLPVCFCALLRHFL